MSVVRRGQESAWDGDSDHFAAAAVVVQVMEVFW